MKLAPKLLLASLASISVIALVARHDADDVLTASGTHPPTSPHEHDPRCAHSRATSERSAVPSDDARELAPTAPATAAAPRTLGDLMREYWGERWPEVEPSLREWCLIAGIDDCLGQLVEVAPKPWESVEPAVELAFFDTTSAFDQQRAALCEWSGMEWTEDVVRKRFGVRDDAPIGPAALETARRIALDFAAPLESKSFEWWSAVDSALAAAWFAGRIEKGPYVTPLYRGTDALFVRTISIDRWSVSVVLLRDEHPLIAQVAADIETLKHSRETAVREYLATL
jgi:hypothetical protein